jgi:YggT family protein
MQILGTLIQVYEFIILARVLMSWIRPDPNNQIVQWLYRLTEPVLAPIRQLIVPRNIGIDFSPIIVFILLDIIRRALIRSVGYY